MTVDLDQNSGPEGGYVTFRNGVQFYSVIVRCDEDQEYEVRLSHGEFRGYTRDGKRCRIGVVDGKKHWVRLQADGEGPWDIVAFERVDYDNSRDITMDFSAACRRNDRETANQS
jgi:hypothetical protein